MPIRKRVPLLFAVAIALATAAGAPAQTYLDLKDQIQEFTLDNGVHFIVLQKHDVPVFSFRTFVNVGSADEVRGVTGLSHILEHMAFKGTSEIGTTDLSKELKLMAAEDEAFAALKRARGAIEAPLARYELLVARIPADRAEAYRPLEGLLKDPTAEVTMQSADGGPAKVTVARADTEAAKVEEFTLGAEETAAVAWYLAELRSLRADLVAAEEAFAAAKDAARELVVTNEFGKIVENHGGNGLNAYTSSDVTVYHYNMPSNRLEMWAYLEGSRMADPVLREFYTEKDGPVTEERRMRTDNNPIGRMIEQFQNLMFMANGYHHSTIGYMSDIETISRADCQAYYDKHYVGSNMVVTVVGDVKVADVRKYAEKYFKDIPRGKPEPVETREPEQLGEKRFVMKDPSQPLFVAGYHIDNVRHPDWPVYEVIADVLGQGRTSRLYKRLVKEEQIAVQAMTFPGFPGQKYETGLLVFALPVKGKTAVDMEEAIYAEIDRMVADGITAEELEGVKQRARANFVRGLQGNAGMASQLAWYQTLMGDWRELFNEVERLEAVTLDDVKRVAARVFRPANRTVAVIETEDS
ncbi:MAG: insulinase family protein [Krumholzibacteria bacterium]|nr:insulinase family protein [Candidatus Krumholzibacteria bacterium]